MTLDYGADLPYDVDLPYGGEEPMALTRGVDVSHYQGSISWAEVAKTPYRFGVARMTIGRSTLDNLGRRNLQAMLDSMPVAGAYGVCGIADPVTDGAKLLLDEIAAAGADPAKILVMLDAEDFGDGSHPTIGQVDAYARQLHADLGRWPVSYTPGWWLDKHGYTATGLGLANCPWAQSHYYPPPWTDAMLAANKPALRFGFKSLAWLQYTDAASVAGVSGGVDADVFYGSLDQLRAQLIGQHEEDLSIVDDATKAYLDDLKADIIGRVDRAVQRVGGRENAVYRSANPDFAGLVMAEEVLAAVKAIAPGELTPQQIQDLGSAIADRLAVLGVLGGAYTGTIELAPKAVP